MGGAQGCNSSSNQGNYPHVPVGDFKLARTLKIELTAQTIFIKVSRMTQTYDAGILIALKTSECTLFSEVHGFQRTVICAHLRDRQDTLLGKGWLQQGAMSDNN